MSIHQDQDLERGAYWRPRLYKVLEKERFAGLSGVPCCLDFLPSSPSARRRRAALLLQGRERVFWAPPPPRGGPPVIAAGPTGKNGLLMAHSCSPLIEAIRQQCGPEPFELAIILGSGLGQAVQLAEILARYDYADYAELPASAVAGHAGYLAAGRSAGHRVLFFVGRAHLYEGHEVGTVVAPVRLARALGCRKLLLTNAAGGIRPGCRPGDFMFVTDHLNLLGANPLRGESPPPFIDLTDLYQTALYPPLATRATERGIRLFSGILAACQGPSYETPAEVRALASLGADAVSMSTIPEAIMARFLGLEVAALSLIANPAAGLGARPLRHDEVLASGRRAAQDFSFLLATLLGLWLDGTDAAAGSDPVAP